MITTAIITLDTLSMTFIQRHSIDIDVNYVDNFYFFKKYFLVQNANASHLQN